MFDATDITFRYITQEYDVLSHMIEALETSDAAIEKLSRANIDDFVNRVKAIKQLYKRIEGKLSQEKALKVTQNIERLEIILKELIVRKEALTTEEPKEVLGDLEEIVFMHIYKLGLDMVEGDAFFALFAKKDPTTKERLELIRDLKTELSHFSKEDVRKMLDGFFREKEAA